MSDDLIENYIEKHIRLDKLKITTKLDYIRTRKNGNYTVERVAVDRGP